MADDIVKNIKNCFLIRYDKSASSVRVRRFLYTDVTRCRFFTTEPQSTQRAPTAQSARSGRTAVDIVVDCTSFLCFSYSKRKDTILLLRQRREGHCRVRVYSLFNEKGVWGKSPSHVLFLSVFSVFSVFSVVKNPIPKFLHNNGYRVRPVSPLFVSTLKPTEVP